MDTPASPTPGQIRRHIADLTAMSGGAPPAAKPLYFSTGWTVYFETELAALRVANRYAGPYVERVTRTPNGWWRVSLNRARR